MTPDLIVRGAGVFGLACALAAARRGARVVLVDPAGPGTGASGGVLGALSPFAPPLEAAGWNPLKRFQFEALVLGRTYWPGIERLSGVSTGYAATGRLQPVPEGGEAAARAREAAARTYWGGASWTVEAAPTAGWAPASPTGLVIRDDLAAHLSPHRAVAAMAAAFAALGGELRSDAPPGAAASVVHATGHAGLAALSEGRARAAGAPVHGQAAVLRLDRRGAPQIFAGGLHVVPHRDGTVAVGSTSEAGRTDLRTDEGLDAVVAAARAAVPALGAAPVIRRWAGLRPRARSRAPVLGPWPGRPGAFVANGGFKIGFGLAPLVGEVMADLVLDGRDRVPDGLRPEDAL